MLHRRDADSTHFRVSGFFSHESPLESATRLDTRGLLLSGALAVHPIYFWVNGTPTRFPTTTARYKTRVSARVYDSARHSGATLNWSAGRAHTRSSSPTSSLRLHYGLGGYSHREDGFKHPEKFVSYGP